MLTLFKKYKEAGKISEALLVGSNIFNHNPSSQDVFEAYFDYLCSLGESLPLLADRQNFANQANSALAFFSENVEISDNVVATILTYQERLGHLFEELDGIKCQQAENRTKAIKSQNSNCLKQLYKLKESLRAASSQEQFEAALAQISEVDNEIDKDALDDEQNKNYEILTKEHSDLISAKMREMEFSKNVAYNKKAADSFADTFKKFRSDESKYKNQTQLFALVSKTLFAYDASRLFNETLIYYNHVYSYIFSKLDDDGKLALTRFSIECERKLR